MLLNITLIRISPVLLKILCNFLYNSDVLKICDSGIRIRAAEKIIGVILLYDTITFDDITSCITFRRFIPIRKGDPRNVGITGYIVIMTSKDRIYSHLTV
jgi:hypothetical protein